MTRVLASSVEVLDGATSMQSMIDTVLAGSDPEYDWSPDIDWWPGDPLYTDPRELMRQMRTRIEEAQDRDDWAEADRLQDECEEGPLGNHVRPMFELAGRRIRHLLNGETEEYFVNDDTMGSHESMLRCYCADCEASGDHSEDECWLCGKAYPLRRLSEPMEFKSNMRLNFDTRPIVGQLLEARDLVAGMEASFSSSFAALRRMMEAQVHAYTSWDVEMTHRMMVVGRQMGRSQLSNLVGVDGLTPNRRWQVGIVEEAPDDRQIVDVFQADVDARPDVPELLRATLPPMRPRALRRALETLPGRPGVSQYWVESHTISIEVPRHIPTRQIPLPVYEEQDWAALAEQRDPYYVRLTNPQHGRRSR